MYAMQAHLAQVDTAEEVQEAMEALLQNNKIQNATHNIMAFRIQLPNSGTYLQVRFRVFAGLSLLMFLLLLAKHGSLKN